jgi:hypothetical protein
VFAAVFLATCLFGGHVTVAHADGLPAPQPTLPATPVTATVQAAVDTTTTAVETAAAPVVETANQTVATVSAAQPAPAVTATVQKTVEPAVSTVSEAAQPVVTKVAAAVQKAVQPVRIKVQSEPLVRHTVARRPVAAKPSAPAPARTLSVVIRRHAVAVRHSAPRTVSAPAKPLAAVAATPSRHVEHVSRPSGYLASGSAAGSGASLVGTTTSPGSSAPAVALTTFAPVAAPAGATVFPSESLLGRGFTPLLVLERPD